MFGWMGGEDSCRRRVSINLQAFGVMSLIVRTMPKPPEPCVDIRLQECDVGK